MNQYPPNQFPPQQYPPGQGAPNPYQAPHPGAQQPYHPQGYLPMQGGYEFGEAENKVVGSAGTWTLVLAIVYFVQALSNFASFNISNMIGGLINLLLGAMFVGASMAFKKVVSTQGQDVPHLLKALDSFGTVLLIRIIGFAFVAVIAVLFGLIFALTAMR